MVGRKIPRKYENPIDDCLIELCDKTIKYIPKHITPNMITIFRIFLGIAVLWSLMKTNEIKYTLAGAIIFYFLDCLDGHLARSTNQVTVVGDYLDHFADLGFLAGIIYYLMNVDHPEKNTVLYIMLVSLVLSFIHLGLQQKKYKKILNGRKHKNFEASLIEYEEEELLSKLNNFHNLSSKNIKWTKYFGLGTSYFIAVGLVLYVKLTSKKFK